MIILTPELANTPEMGHHYGVVGQLKVSFAVETPTFYFRIIAHFSMLSI